MMKRIIFLILILFPFVLVSWLLSKGIVVVYERSTGPELIILSGKENLLNKSRHYGINNVNCAYTTYEFDSEYGFENIGISFAFYKIINSKKVEDNEHEKVALLKIDRFYSVTLILFLIMFYYIILFFFRKKYSKKNKLTTPTLNLK